MTKEPNKVVTLPSGDTFMSEEAKFLNKTYHCDKCQCQRKVFFVTGFKHHGPLEETVFCETCLSVLYKPAPFGRSFSSTHMKVTANYTDGSSSLITGRYIERCKTLKTVEHCDSVMRLEQTTNLNDGEILEYQFECPVCKYEREIRAYASL